MSFVVRGSWFGRRTPNPERRGSARHSVGRNRSLARRRGGRRSFFVDELLELLAGLEVRHLLRRHIHLVAGFRVAALPRLTLAQPETAEAAQLDLLAAVQRLDDAAED